MRTTAVGDCRCRGGAHGESVSGGTGEDGVGRLLTSSMAALRALKLLVRGFAGALETASTPIGGSGGGACCSTAGLARQDEEERARER